MVIAQKQSKVKSYKTIALMFPKAKVSNGERPIFYLLKPVVDQPKFDNSEPVTVGQLPNPAILGEL